MTVLLTNAQLKELLEKAGRVTYGCGDRNCKIKRPVGMATDGGCRCLRDVQSREARWLFEACSPDVIQALVTELQERRRGDRCECCGRPHTKESRNQRDGNIDACERLPCVMCGQGVSRI